MKLETFFEKFDELANSPDAVARMRELVLRMATSGRIAEQDPANQPGSELLTELFAIRDRLNKRDASKIRTYGNSITAGDTIELPRSWARCVISEVCDLQTGATPSRMEGSYFGGDIPWLVSGDINKGEITECHGRITKEGLENSNCKIIPANSVLIALNGQGKTRATVAVLRIPAAMNQSLVAMIPYSRERLLPEYVFWNLRGRYHAIRDITGQDQRRGLNMRLVGQLSLPIPPLAEQKRIVAKVDELMELCDRLEAQQKEREMRHVALTHASLVRFADAPTPANLNFIFHKSYDISSGDLRKSILTLAVQGKLVPQDPKDEPVEISVRVARKEAGLAVRALSVMGLDEIPFEAPESWRRVTVADVAEARLGKMLDREKNRGEAHPYLRNTNVHWFRFELESIKTMLFESSELDEYRIEPGDVMICEGGHGIARSAVWNGQIPGIMFQKALHRVRPLPCLSGRFLSFCLWVYERNGILRRYYTGAGIPHFTGKALARVTFPLPPLAEQRRIVAKVDRLMAMVDSLETQLAASRATAANLLSAVIAQLTSKD